MIRAGAPRASKGRWPGNLRRVTITVAVGDALNQGVYGLLDRVWARGLAGTSGHVYNVPSPGITGAVDAPQLARMHPSVASRGAIGDPRTALPGTNGGYVVTGSVRDSLANLPVGWKR